MESPPGFVETTEANGDLFQDVDELGYVASPTTFSPVEECFETGLIFGPNCVDRCFIHNIYSSFDEKKCAHTWQSVNLSRTGEFVSFPSSFFHRGYFKMKENQIVVTAQLFASDNGSSPNHPSRHLASKNSMDAVNTGMVTIDLTRLSEDVLLRWDVNYPISEFPPCKSFGGVRIKTESNRQIHKSKFARVPHLARLVKAFKDKYNSLSIDQVWLIRKSHSEVGFQRWHQDLPKLEGERAIVKSIVVNIGQMTARFPEDDGSILLLKDNEPSTPEVKVGSPEESSPELEIVGYQKALNEQHTYHGKLSIDEGWKWVTKFHKPQPSKARHLYCALSCDECSPTGFMFLAKSSTNITLEQWPGGNRALFKDSLPWQTMTYIANHLLSRKRI